MATWTTTQMCGLLTSLCVWLATRSAFGFLLALWFTTQNVSRELWDSQWRLEPSPVMMSLLKCLYLFSYWICWRTTDRVFCVNRNLYKAEMKETAIKTKRFAYVSFFRFDVFRFSLVFVVRVFHAKVNNSFGANITTKNTTRWYPTTKLFILEVYLLGIVPFQNLSSLLVAPLLEIGSCSYIHRV